MSMADGKTVAAPKPKITRVEVYWHTVKYRTVVLLVLCIIAIIGASVYLVFPQFSEKTLERFTNTFAPSDNPAANAASRQARFRQSRRQGAD